MRRGKGTRRNKEPIIHIRITNIRLRLGWEVSARAKQEQGGNRKLIRQEERSHRCFMSILMM